MTLTVEDDFREFVAARWPDLEGVAFVVTLDAASARRVTTNALAELHGRWRDALDGGRPGELARRSVLGAAIAAASGSEGPRPAAATSVDHTSFPAPDDPADPDDDGVLTALVHAIHAASPLERALVGTASMWGARPDEVADLLGMPSAAVGERLVSLRGRLLDVHTRARADAGLGPAEWALDGDLDAAVERLLAGQGDPPDPDALVEERRRSVRRRSLLTGGAAVLATAGIGAWWLGRDGPAGGAAGATGATGAGTGARPAVTTPGPTDASWARTATWPPRGALARDVDLQALVISRSATGSRLLWADDVGDRRLVVIGSLGSPQTTSTDIRVFHGPRGADPRALRELDLRLRRVDGVSDVVALSLPHGEDADSGRSVVVVLARPTVISASVSRLVRPTPRGTLEREWVDLPLVEGTVAQVFEGPVSPATRVRVAGFDGPPATSVPIWLEGRSGEVTPTAFTRVVHRYVESATGIPAARLTTEVVADAPVSGSVLDPDALSATGGDGRVVALLTRTPDGAVLSSVVVTDDGRAGGGTVALRPALLLPARRADDPVVEQVSDLRAGVGRFLVIAPGAATVQLIATSPGAYPVSKVVATKGAAAAVVPLVNADVGGALRLVAKDSAGRVLHDDVPVVPRLLLDLWPSGPGA